MRSNKFLSQREQTVNEILGGQIGPLSELSMVKQALVRELVTQAFGRGWLQGAEYQKEKTEASNG